MAGEAFCHALREESIARREECQCCKRNKVKGLPLGAQAFDLPICLPSSRVLPAESTAGWLKNIHSDQAYFR